MNTLAIRRAAGTLLVIVPLVFTACSLLLLQRFEYADILRQPSGDVLAKFAAGGTPLIAVWYVLTALGAVLVVGGASYMIDMLARFLVPALGESIHNYLAIPPTIAEIWMVGYLLVKGVRTPLAVVGAPAPAEGAAVPA